MTFALRPTLPHVAPSRPRTFANAANLQEKSLLIKSISSASYIQGVHIALPTSTHCKVPLSQQWEISHDPTSQATFLLALLDRATSCQCEILEVEIHYPDAVGFSSALSMDIVEVLPGNNINVVTVKDVVEAPSVHLSSDASRIRPSIIFMV
ncbi:hypothetical protein K474DRAFT_1680335 [Panus rudis PR-1116 ss-1]|nr:hypothetical protein K474DRAFT_1680335 [Panus rudis PR-1116 ss-1]